MNGLIDLLDILILGRDVEFAVLLFFRLVPIVVLSPLFGGVNASRRFRMGFTAVLTIVLLPSYAPGSDPPSTEGAFVRMLTSEIVVGISLAIAISIIFEMLAAAGAVIDMSRGATIANILSPLTKQQSSITTSFLMQMFLVVFVSAGGLRVFIQGLATGLTVIPPGGPLPSRFQGGEGIAAFIELLGDLFATAVQMAMPVVLVILVVDASLGLINRVAPRIQAYFLGLTLKATLGILVVFLMFGMVTRVALDTIVKSVDSWLLAG